MAKNLIERMTKYPEEMWLPSNLEVEVGIPNWHINKHGMDCQNNLSLSYIPGVRRTVMKMSKHPGHIQTPLLPVCMKWGLALTEKHWMTTGMDGILGKLLIFVSSTFYLVVLMYLAWFWLYFLSASRMLLQCIKGMLKPLSNFWAPLMKIHIWDGQWWLTQAVSFKDYVSIYWFTL